jgi:hypothetical protein
MSKARFDQSDEVTLSYDASDSDVPKGLYFINYHTYESNNPNAGNNKIGFFKADANGIISADATALAVVNVSADGNADTYSIKVDRKTGVDYAFAYLFGTSLDPTKDKFGTLPVAAVLALPKTLTDLNSPAALYKFGLSVTVAGSGAMVEYTGIQNTSPRNNNHWVGIWDDDNFSFDNKPAFAALVGDNLHDSDVRVPNNTFLTGHSYTAFYFAGGYDSSDANNSKKDSIATWVKFNA